MAKPDSDKNEELQKANNLVDKKDSKTVSYTYEDPEPSIDLTNQGTTASIPSEKISSGTSFYYNTSSDLEKDNAENKPAIIHDEENSLRPTGTTFTYDIDEEKNLSDNSLSHDYSYVDLEQDDTENKPVVIHDEEENLTDHIAKPTPEPIDYSYVDKDEPQTPVPAAEVSERYFRDSVENKQIVEGHIKELSAVVTKELQTLLSLSFSINSNNPNLMKCNPINIENLNLNSNQLSEIGSMLNKLNHFEWLNSKELDPIREKVKSFVSDRVNTLHKECSTIVSNVSNKSLRNDDLDSHMEKLSKTINILKAEGSKSSENVIKKAEKIFNQLSVQHKAYEQYQKDLASYKEKNFFQKLFTKKPVEPSINKMAFTQPQVNTAGIARGLQNLTNDAKTIASSAMLPIAKTEPVVNEKKTELKSDPVEPTPTPDNSRPKIGR